MIKKLDLLILKSFIGPFIVTFFIAIFVLMMQVMWKYIDDLVGKGLDIWTVAQFVWYASAQLLILAMPIAIIISTIMTFGNLGESFELIAIKSSGISLLRFMRPLIFFNLILCFVTFLFANNVVPYANLKFMALYNDIFYKKPAFELKPGVFFTTIPSYAIRIGGKNKDGSQINDVLIYEDKNPLQDFTIKAEKGRMTISPDKNFLEFNLTNGARYWENGNVGDSVTDYTRLEFKEFKKLFDLSIFHGTKTSDSVFKNSGKMMSARQLNKNLDSLYKQKDSADAQVRRMVNTYFKKNRELEKNLATVPAAHETLKIPDSVRGTLSSQAFGTLNEIKSNYQFNTAQEAGRGDAIITNKVEWHRKFAFSLACMVLLFIGAPLGSIIRKGGIGMPLVVAIVFFLIFHLLYLFGEKFVKAHLLTPWIGMWLAVIVLTPVGIFLTYKAMHDSQLFNKEFFYRVFRRFRLPKPDETAGTG